MPMMGEAQADVAARVRTRDNKLLANIILAYVCVMLEGRDELAFRRLYLLEFVSRDDLLFSVLRNVRHGNDPSPRGERGFMS